MECRLCHLLEMGDATLVFGDVVQFHIDASIWRDGRVDMTRLAPIGRLSGSDYSTVERIQSLRRPVWTPD
jgi:flavin reductase (DIM6/NTAB) family NADH-FMN oxidoreductase RutF